MTDPERLLAGGTAFERGLLAAGAADKPSAAMVARMGQGLGLSSTAASAATLKLVAAAIGTTVAGGLAAWGLLTSDGSSSDAGKIDQARELVVPAPAAAPERASDSRKSNGASEKSGAAAPGAVDDGATDESAAISPRELPLVGQRRTLREKDTKPGAAIARDQLSEEVRELDRVRAALEARKKQRAIELLDGYDRRFPSGALAPEARKLRQSARELD